MKSGLFLLKAAAFAGMFAMMFPLVVFAQIFDGMGFDAARAVIFFLFGAVASVLGMLLDLPAAAIKNEKPRRVYRAFSRTAAYFAGLSALLFRKAAGLGGMELFMLMALLSYCCVLGLKNRAAGFREIYSAPFLAAFSMVSAAVAFFCAGFAPGDVSARTALAGVFIAEFIIAAVMLNQANISKHAERRRDAAALTPKNLRLFNISLILPVGIVFAFAYMFRAYIAAALFFLAGKTADAFGALLKTPVSPNPPPAAETKPTSGEPVGGAPDLSALGALMFAAYTFGALFALYKMRHIILNSIKYAIAGIISLFARKKEKGGRPAAFTDYFEEIVYEKKKKRKKSALRTCIRLYGREKRPAEKIRLSYRIFLLWLKKRGADVMPSHTVEAHIALPETGGDFGEYAEIYSRVRYGEESGEDGVAAVDGVVRGFER
ncbi:MAG: hypothetical protein LBI38_01015 [Oscillospiraceae bacterium]|jgi:hypothetical protein|nr:hypothetical protein [Oscillospiraceae bacterium]